MIQSLAMKHVSDYEGPRVQYGTSLGRMCFYAKKTRISPCEFNRLGKVVGTPKPAIGYYICEMNFHRSRSTDGEISACMWVRYGEGQNYNSLTQISYACH